MLTSSIFLFFPSLPLQPLGTDPQSGRVDPELAAAARDEYKQQFGLRK